VEDLDFVDTQDKFLKKGIHVRHGVDNLLHRLQGKNDNEFPNSFEAFKNTLSIPIYPALSESEQGQIIEATNIILS
jgi:UDP-4-amino-4-deoxy-L-arabinose-oxoglutarate aminotransferase